MGRSWFRCLVLAVALGLVMIGYLPGAGARLAAPLPGQMAEARAAVPDEEGMPMSLSSTPRSGGPTGEATSLDGDRSAACDLTTAVKTSTITVETGGVSAPCVLVSAGDLVTWVNATTAPIEVRTGDDRFFTEDVSDGFSAVRVPTGGQVRVRLIHPGRVGYTVSSPPGGGGTILVLARGAA
jgi:hypothetical protein